VWICIIATPPGDTPEEVRRAWVGLELPLAAGARGPWLVPIGDVRGLSVGPYSFLTSLRGALTRRWVRAYLVHTSRALALLAEKDPEAVRWWRERRPALWKPGRKFIFPREVCAELPDAERPSPVAPVHPLRQELMGHLAALTFLVWFSALVIVAGVACAALPFVPHAQLPWPVHALGYVGLGLGLIGGAIRNLATTWNGYREVRGARGLLHEWRATFSSGVREDLEDADSIQPYASLILMALPAVAWWLLRSRVSDGWGVVLLVICGLVWLFGMHILTGWAMDRWGQRPAEGEAPAAVPLQPDGLAAGLAPRVLMLLSGSVVGTLLMLVGAARMVHGMATQAEDSLAFFGGLEVALGGFLGGGRGLFDASILRGVLARLAPILARRRRWEWSGWKTVMEDPSWNGFDQLTVAWVAVAALAGAATLLVREAMPWLFAYGLQYLVLAFLIKGCLFVWVRDRIRRRRAQPVAQGERGA
jgi:hypothetical protein